MSSSSIATPSLSNDNTTAPKKRGRKPKIGVVPATSELNTLVIDESNATSEPISVDVTSVVVTPVDKPKVKRTKKKSTEDTTNDTKEKKVKKVKDANEQKEKKVKEPKEKKVKPKKEIEEVEECPCCIEKYTPILRKKAVCKYCKADTCSKCIERYLLEGINDAHCMHCRVNYNDTTLREICTMTYVQQVYFKHRQEVLLNREKANLPGLQDSALEERNKRDREAKIAVMRKELLQMEENLKNMNDQYYEVYNVYYSKLGMKEDVLILQKQLQDINTQMDKYRDEIHKFKMKIYDTRYPAHIDSEGNKVDADKEERKKFIRRCTRNNCQGFLSTAWKCGLCEYYSCSKCFMTKTKKQDDPHECKKEDIETADMIKKDSKPCPNCGEFIMKSSGCFAKDTPILMWNGSTKMSQDIKIGDELVGDDGNKRIVLDLCNGVDTMYEVKQTSGMTYIVNSKHTLVLRFNSNRDENTVIYDKLKMYETDDCNYHILVDEYILLDDNIKKLLVGYKVNPYTISDIQVSEIGLGEYFGWKVDCNSKFLLNDFTTLHNCSQMFCISCKTPWDWNTGKVVVGGMIHNPHYYEWMRRNGMAEGIRNPADVPCGGYPNAWELRRIPRTVRADLSNKFYEFHRICQEIQDISQETYRSHIDNTTTTYINIKFLLNDYNEEHWGQLLAKNERKRKRDSEVQEIFGAFRMVAVELLNRIQNYTTVTATIPPRTLNITQLPVNEIEEQLTQFGIEVDALIDMINDAMKQVSVGYHYVVPKISKSGKNNEYYALIHKNFYEDVKADKREALAAKAAAKSEKLSTKSKNKNEELPAMGGAGGPPVVEVPSSEYFADDTDDEGSDDDVNLQAAINASLQ